MKQTFLSILLMLLPMMASAETVEIGGIWYNLIPIAKEAEVKSNPNTYSGDVNIPSSITYNGQPYSVTSIGDYAFNSCSGLTSVTIPNSVTSIGYEAFRDCSGLTSVTIPNSVTSIGYETFCGCSSLSSVSIPNSVTSIGSNAFYGTEWYKNQPDGLVYAGKVAYKYKGEMPENTSIIIEDGTLEIADAAFQFCSALTSVTIPSSVTSIGNSAFYYCSALTSVTIPSGVTSIGNSAFAGTPWLNNLPDGLVYIGKVVYGYKGNMPENTSIIIEDGTSEITGAAFSGCSGLTSITLPNSITSICESTFSGCSGLTSVTIPNSVTSIDSYAFNECSGLTSITFPNSITSIGYNAFKDCSGLTSITIPNSVTSIGDEAFRGCSGLTSVTIPNSVTDIGNYAFYGCSSLTSVTIPTSVTHIGGSAFQNCGLTSVTIPYTVTYIGGDAFNGCHLTSITIPSGVKYIGSSAFANLKLTDVTCLAEKLRTDDWTDEGLLTANNAFYASTIESATLHVPAASKSAYQAIEPWKNFKGIVASTMIANDLAFDKTRVSVAYGDVFTPPTLTNPHSLLVNYDSSNHEVALVDPTSGAVTFITTGEVDIKAEFLGTDEYVAGCASYHLIINKKNAALAFAQPTATATYSEAFTEPALTNPNSLTVTYESSEPTVATVATDGKVTVLKAGETTISAKFAGNGIYEASTVSYVLTVNPKTVSSPTITLSATSFAYDGTAKQPTVTVKDGSTTIPASEYTVGYSNNTNVGTATVTITDKAGGNYTVSGTTTFAIAAADGSLTPPVGKTGLFFTGTAQNLITAGSSPTGTVHYSLDGTTYDTAIPQGTDAKEYTIYYKVVAKAGYKDVAPASFKVTISPKTVSSPTITLSATSFAYDGTAKQPTVTVKDGSTTIPASEYTVGYSNNINVGTATVTITDKTGGNYTVSGSTTFVIVLRGDANGDNKVDVADIVEMVNAKAGRASAKFQMANADTDNDGSITETDINAVSRIIMGE